MRRAPLLLAAALLGVTSLPAEAQRAEPPPPRPEAAPPPSAAAAAGHRSFTRSLPCSSCHSPAGWHVGGGSSADAGGFDHARTGFPLSGRHLRVGCTRCHGADRNPRRPCVSCHRDPHQGRLGTECARCHAATSWADTRAIELHRLTRLPLTGMHAIAACSDCHRRGADRTYSAVPAECIACHERDYRRPGLHPRHEGGPGAPFPRDCTQCHRTTSWSPAIVDASLLGASSGGLTEAPPPSHELRFPLRAGSHRGLSCDDCHEDPRVPAAIRCVGCHAHRPARLRAQHPGAPPGPDGRGCLACHPGGIGR